jgi:hypothetical protein
MIFFVVILVPRPQKAVHDIFMRKPGDKLHNNKGRDINYAPQNDRNH